MKIRWFISILVTVLWGACRVSADPANFMVENFTFVAPEKWKWITPESKGRKAQLRITTEHKPDAGDVVFYWYPTENKQGDPDECLKRWQAQFREKNKVLPTIERTTLGRFKILYGQMEGVYKGFGKESLSLTNYALLGAIVPTSKGTLMVRLTGPKELVYKSTKPFKKMVEDGLKEE